MRRPADWFRQAELDLPPRRLIERSRGQSWRSTMSAVFHRLDIDGVLERLRRYAANELATRPEVRDVVLIGSLARGDWSARSDADVVIIVDGSTEPGPHRGPAYAPGTAIGVAVDVFVYTAAEASAWSSRSRREVERGLVLYGRVDP